MCSTSIGMEDLISSINSSTHEKTKGGRPKRHSKNIEDITIVLISIDSYRIELFQSTTDQRDYHMDEKREFPGPCTAMFHEYCDCHVCRYVVTHQNLSRKEFQLTIRDFITCYF